MEASQADIFEPAEIIALASTGNDPVPRRRVRRQRCHALKHSEEFTKPNNSVVPRQGIKRKVQKRCEPSDRAAYSRMNRARQRTPPRANSQRMHFISSSSGSECIFRSSGSTEKTQRKAPRMQAPVSAQAPVILNDIESHMKKLSLSDQTVKRPAQNPYSRRLTVASELPIVDYTASNISRARPGYSFPNFPRELAGSLQDVPPSLTYRPSQPSDHLVPIRNIVSAFEQQNYGYISHIKQLYQSHQPTVDLITNIERQFDDYHGKQPYTRRRERQESSKSETYINDLDKAKETKEDTNELFYDNLKKIYSRSFSHRLYDSTRQLMKTTYKQARRSLAGMSSPRAGTINTPSATSHVSTVSDQIVAYQAK